MRAESFGATLYGRPLVEQRGALRESPGRRVAARAEELMPDRYVDRRCPSCGEVCPSADLVRVPPQEGSGVEPRYRCPACGHVAQMWTFRKVEPLAEGEEVGG